MEETEIPVIGLFNWILLFVPSGREEVTDFIISRGTCLSGHKAHWEYEVLRWRDGG
jgi:hypothetical protein